MKLVRYICALAFLLGGAIETTAQNNWDGDNPLGNFTWCSNWFADTCPATWNNTTDLNFNFRNNAAQTTLYFDLGGWRNVRNITFANTFAAGLPFDSDGNGFDFYGKIENYTANYTQTFNLPVSGRSATAIEINPVNGPMVFNQPIYNPNNTNFQVWGNNGRKLTLNNYPAGNAATQLAIKQYSIVEVNYNNAASLSGGYVVESGELWVNSAGVIQGPIQVGNGTANFNKIYISHASTATTVANTITVPTNSPNATIGSLNTSGIHTYSGAINLNNNDVTIDPFGGGFVNFTGAISGTGGIRKISTGTATLSASNTYTGNTVLNAGTLRLGNDNVIADASNLTFNGGIFNTSVGYSDTVGTLALTGNTIVALGLSSHTLNFAASNAVAWTAGRTLTVTGWIPGCSNGRIFFGNSATALTAAQLAQITFSGYPAGAKLTAAGELIPNNIVLQATGGTTLGAYATLRAAFTAINSGTHTGVISIHVADDTTETLVAQLNNNAAATSVLIQPTCGPKTITGSFAGGPLIDFNGADNVVVNGINSGGTSLTISNTNTSNTSGTSTIRFQTDATNNTITNCTVLGSSSSTTGTNGGNIWFGSNSALTGNDNNTVSNCNIGPAGANRPSKGIYFSGTLTTGLENNNITITNNKIYDVFSSTVNSADIEIINGSTAVTITNNHFYQTGVRSIGASVAHSSIRIVNANGNGYVITGNTIGYSNSSGTGTSSYVYSGGFNFTLYGISISVGSTTATSIQGNTIAGISESVSLTANATVFSGIAGSGYLNIGDVTGNTIGLPAAPINVSNTGTFSTILSGISISSSAAAVNIQNNTLQSINLSGDPTTILTLNGITISGSAVFNVTGNTIGNMAVNGALSIGSTPGSTGVVSFRGITSSATGNVTIGAAGAGNAIQNVLIYPTANNNARGIEATGANATTNIGYNTIKGFNIASTTATGSLFAGIVSSGAVTGAVNISNNQLGDSSNGFISYGAACSGAFNGISVSSAPNSATLTMNNNDIRGISYASTATSAHNYLSNSAPAGAIAIENNTFTNLYANTTGTTTFITNSAISPATGSKNVNNNRIVGTFGKAAGGDLTLYSDTASSVLGAVAINNGNDFSNITVAGSSAILGWRNIETNSVKTITANVFNNWTAGTGAITAFNSTQFRGNSSVSNNTMLNYTSGGNVIGINVGTTGNATLLDVSSNTISNLSSAAVVSGIANDQPATTLAVTTNNNNISGLSSSTASNVYGMRESALSASKTISGNTVNNCSSLGVLWGINTGNGGSISVSNNTVSNLSTSGDNRVLGIYAGLSASTNISITGNTISEITNTSTGSSARVHALEAAGTAPATISNNTIFNCYSAGVNATTSLIGVYLGNTNATSTIQGNTIHGLSITNNTATPIGLTAIFTNATSSGGTIAKNRVYGLSNATTIETSSVIGCVLTGGNWTLANNMISIVNNDMASASGISEINLSGTRKYFYNSIYIGGTSPGPSLSNGIGSFGNSEFKNNILYNNRSSSDKNYALALLGISGLSSNYNIFYSLNPSTVVLMGSDRSFPQWQTLSGGDGNSFSGNAISFVDANTADLHILGGCTDAESGGIPVAVTDDYDAQARHASTPDIGADEFTGSKPADVTCPNTAVCLGSSTVLNAASSDATYTYTWSPATGLDTTTGAIVNANPTATTTYLITATSPSGCVKTKYVTVTVHPLPAPISVAPPVITACLNTIQSFTASPVGNSSITVGQQTGTSLAASTPYRQGISTSESRVQYLITKAEMNAMGMLSAAKITSIGFTVSSTGFGAMPSYTISMAHTAATSLTNTYIATGFTTVFTATNLTPTSGLNTHIFSTPFQWDGVSNIVLNICHTGPGGIASNVYTTTFTSPMTTSGIATGQCGIATGTTNLVRPLITIGCENQITWSPITELYTDAAATVPYVANTHYPTVYVKPSAPRVYTATLTAMATGCTVTATGTFTTAVSTWDGTAWSPSVPTGGTSLNFTGSYFSTGDLSGCSCTVTSGDVIINGPHAMTLTEGLTVNSGPGVSMTFLDTSSLLQTNDAAVNSGIIRMERTTQPMYRYDFTYWGSPMTLGSNFTLGQLSPFTLADKYFSWTPTVGNSFGTWIHETTATVMVPAKGYIVRAPQTFSMNPLVKTPYTGPFEGTPNNGIVTIPIYHGTVPSPNYNDDYNLLSNPYPSAVDAEKLLSDPLNVPVLDGTIYFWTHNSPVAAANPDPFYGDFIYNYNANDYASWNKLGGTGTTSAAGTGGMVPNGFIAAGQGFFTRSAGAASGAVATFNNSMRVAGNNGQFFRNAHPNGDFEKHRIWLNLVSNNGSFNQILVGYAEGATMDWDRSYDGAYFSEVNTIEFYSVIPNHKLVIQGRALPFSNEDLVPLGFKTAANNTFSFRIDHFDALFENQDIYIEDLLLGIVHDLKQSPYTFTSEAGTFDTRFVLRFTDTTLQNSEFLAAHPFTAFTSKSQLYVESAKAIESVSVFDISGKRLMQFSADKNKKSIQRDFAMANGVYLLKIEFSDGTTATAKVLH
ncbi:autotransporter-associated beta strand repeat-containing protein [Flavobacterium sp.]|uniref:autotransporter-associated beta strand repeat-containing protein n=1 Tax=Flavobacterium sp. TaxID=239 RepID=UPI0039E72B38